MIWQKLEKCFTDWCTSWKVDKCGSICFLRFSSFSWRNMSRISLLSESMRNTRRILCAKQGVPRTSWSYRSSVGRSTAHFFRRHSGSCSQTHMSRTPLASALLRFQGQIEKSCHQVIKRLLALLECDDNHFHYHERTPVHLRNNSRYCLAVWRYTKQAKVVSPTSLPMLMCLSALRTVRWIRA